MGMLRVFWPVLLLVMVIGYVLGVALPPVDDPPTLWSGVALLVLAGALAYVVNHCRRGYAMFLKGARGEEQTARILGFLPSGFYVFHSLQLPQSTGSGAGDFDHVVVGPNGVFVIETKNWSGDIDTMDGQVYVDGEPAKRSPVEQVKDHGAMFSEWIREQEKVTPKVHEVLCFVGSDLPGGSKMVDGVTVCDGRSLASVLTDGVTPGRGLDGVHTRVCHALQLHVQEGEA